MFIPKAKSPISSRGKENGLARKSAHQAAGIVDKFNNSVQSALKHLAFLRRTQTQAR